MMKRKLLSVFALSIFLVVSAKAHDLFLKLNDYFPQPNSAVTVRLMNGDYWKSENAVERNRFQDVSLIIPAGKRLNPPLADWFDKGTEARLNLPTADAGTYVLGLSTKPRELEMKARAFNDYLAHDGVPDMLAKRKRDGELNKHSQERYSKHVKALFQVGAMRTENFKTPLGYPVEIIPQQNPYELKPGKSLEVLCLKDGAPIVNQFVMVGREVNGKHLASPSVRTDASGVARIGLRGAGKWYIKFIHMTDMSEAQVNYESKWASLTFEIR